MALLLNIETTTDVCSVALSKDGHTWVLREIEEKNIHSQRLTRLIEALFEDVELALADIDAIAVSEGPGSYTGLRIGLSTAKGLCYGLDKPLLAVSTLRALAAEGYWRCPQTYVLALQDARRMDAYAALYSPEGEVLLEPSFQTLKQGVFDAYLPEGSTVTVVGNAAFKFRGLTGSKYKWQFTNVGCSAHPMASLAEEAYQAGDFEDLAYFEPFYLKRPHITKAKKLL